MSSEGPGTNEPSGPDSDHEPGVARRSGGERRSALRLVRLLRRSLRIAWDAAPRLLLVSGILQLVAGLLALLQILVIKSVLTSVIATPGTTAKLDSTLLPVALLALIIGVTTASTAAQQQLQRLLSELVTRRTWEGILDVTTSVTLSQYDTPEFYDHLQRVQTNAISRPFVLTQALVSFAGAVASSAALVVAVVALQPILLPLIIVSGVPLYAALRRGGNLEFAFAVAQTPRLRLRFYLQELQTDRDAAKEVRAFGIAPPLRSRYERVYDAFVADLRRHVKRRTILSLASGMASAAILALTMFAIVWLVFHHHLSLAAAGAALVAVRALAGQISGLFTSVQQMFESGLFLEDLDRFLATRPGADGPVATVPAPGGFERLDVENVSFSYPGSRAPALRDVSMSLRQGEVVALVGENGSGKTTLAKLLSALYQPAEGVIRWDGVDAAVYDQAGLRRHIGAIFQDFVRYQLSGRANIALGRPDADEEDAGIMEAARRSGVASVLESLPDGYDTILSKAFEGGHELSGGQWQRVALARAFYRDASFMILDEPSAALDPRAEYELFGALRKLLAGRTVLYISHRLSTVRDADRIYVLSAGQIVEHGSHRELMELGGRYAELFTMQATAYTSQDN